MFCFVYIIIMYRKWRYNEDINLYNYSYDRKTKYFNLNKKN